MPKVAVIIPVYNVEKYLPQCLDSVISQTLQDIEIICVNDGSTDNCGKILQEYAAKDKRITVIEQENKGLSSARNAGFAKSTAEYVSFIDSDDFVHPQFLEVLYKAISQTKCEISGCDFKKIYDNEIPEQSNNIVKIYPALDALLNRKNFIHYNVWNKLYRRDVIKDISFAEGIFYEDWVFNICVFARIEAFAWINSPLYGYRMSDCSIMRSQFNLQKLDSYDKGIEIVTTTVQTSYPDLWKKVKCMCISRIVKMMMNSALRSKNDEIKRQVACVLQNLYDKHIVGYKGLSWFNKVKLYKFLNMKV